MEEEDCLVHLPLGHFHTGPAPKVHLYRELFEDMPVNTLSGIACQTQQNLDLKTGISISLSQTIRDVDMS